MPVRRINVKSEQPDPAVVAEVARAIGQGRLVALPTETVYGLAADPDSAGSVARLRAVKGRPDLQEFTHHVASTERLEALAAPPPPRVRRLLARYWPGPLTIVLPGLATPSVGVRVPAHSFTSAVLAEFEHGLLLSSTNRHGETPLITPDQIAARLPEIDLLCDAGPPPLGQASSVVRWAEPELQVLREGTLTSAELLRTAASAVLFVCTGNTCRSPLAEVVAKRAVAAALQTEPNSLPARGLWITSAGTAAADGWPASENSVYAASEAGLDLSAHRSRALTRQTLLEAARVYALSAPHLANLLELAPEVGDRASLLRPDDDDIPDPYGGDLEVYRAAREAITAGIQARLDEILALIEH